MRVTAFLLCSGPLETTYLAGHFLLDHKLGIPHYCFYSPRTEAEHIQGMILVSELLIHLFFRKHKFIKMLAALVK